MSEPIQVNSWCYTFDYETDHVLIRLFHDNQEFNLRVSKRDSESMTDWFKLAEQKKMWRVEESESSE